jgi:hypothetical protein
MTYFITFRDIASDKATSISMELADKAFNHLLTAADAMTTVAPSDDLFTYSTNIRSRYTSTIFMGIMVDIGASTKSIAGYGQYQALKNVDSSAKLDISTKGQVSV